MQRQPLRRMKTHTNFVARNHEQFDDAGDDADIKRSVRQDERDVLRQVEAGDKAR
jgi:hypothetical protein